MTLREAYRLNGFSEEEIEKHMAIDDYLREEGIWCDFDWIEVDLFIGDDLVGE